MNKQYIVIGADRFGASVARTLEEEGNQVLVIDRDPERIEMIAKDVSYAVTADITRPDIANELNLSEMDGAVIAIENHMEASIVAALMCRDANVPEVIARGKNDVHKRILKQIGVSSVIYPEREMGVRVGHYLTVRDFKDWIDLSPEYSLVELHVPSRWYGKTIGELKLRSDFGLNVVGILKDGKMDVQFTADDRVDKNMVLYVIGKNTDLERFPRD